MTQNVNMHDRRNFIKGSAFFAASALATTALASVGCSPTTKGGTNASSSSTASASTTVADNRTWDGEYDVIVVGAGIAGLTAAITVATEGNGASCLLIEKGASPLGNSPFCAGYSIWTKDADAEYVYLDALTGEDTPEDVLRSFATALTEQVDWLKAVGAKDEWLTVTEPDPTTPAVWEHPELPNSNYHGVVLFNAQSGGPSHVFEFLYDVMQNQAGIDYKPSTPLENLVQDPTTKTILGVEANGAFYKANKGVIMCCGGFESDQEMLHAYTGSRGVPYAGILNTGDGHRACQKIGADFWHMRGGALYWMGPRNLADTSYMSTVWSYTSKECGITVAINGRRFYNDYDGCAAPFPSNNPDGNDATSVGYRHGVTQFGGQWTHLPMPDKAWFVFDKNGLAAGAIPQSVSTDPVADGWCLEAPTIEELAALIEVPVKEFSATVDQWNEFCDRGRDMAFYRPENTLTKVAEGPFYAMLCRPALLNTDGGPVRDGSGRILDPDGNAIPGLYSAGEFGSLWGHKYQGAGNVAECMAFGRISARSALTSE